MILLACALEYPEIGVQILRLVRTYPTRDHWTGFIAGIHHNNHFPNDKFSDYEIRQLNELQARNEQLALPGPAVMSGLQDWAERVQRYTFGN